MESEKLYPGKSYQRLHDAIDNTWGCATQSEMDEIIRIVHEDFPKERERGITINADPKSKAYIIDSGESIGKHLALLQLLANNPNLTVVGVSDFEKLAASHDDISLAAKNLQSAQKNLNFELAQLRESVPETRAERRARERKNKKR